MAQIYGGQKSGPGSSGGFGGRGDGDRGSGRGGEGDVVSALQSKLTLDLWNADARKSLRHELLDREAQDRAKQLSEVPPSQLRRFYAPVISFKQRLLIDSGITDNEVMAQIAYMKASSAYAGARKQPKALVEFFVAAANTVKTREDFIGFARHFEAVIAFHKVYGTEKKD